MNLLFDQNISFRLIEKIKKLYPNARQVRSLGLENASDKEIWKFAKSKKYTIVTFDSDFYDFSIIWGHPPKIIWIRTGNLTTKSIEKIIKNHADTIRKFIEDKELACLEIIN